MWIRIAIELPHNFGVCQKTVGNLARDFYRGGERKTQTSWIWTTLKSPTTPVNSENHLHPPEKQIPSELGFREAEPLRSKDGQTLSNL